MTKANKIELVFIRATRNDETKGLTSCLCRSELLEAIVRLATNVYFSEEASKNPANAVERFFKRLI